MDHVSSRQRLTRKQRELLRELDEIVDRVGLDHHGIAQLNDTDERTSRLELAKRQAIASAVVQRYVLCDELMGSVIALYFFGRKRGFPALWRTKRFQRFNYFVLEKLTFVHKLDLVNDLRRLPKPVRQYLDHLNGIRNAVAHAFFPENLRGQRLDYKGRSIFTLEGFREWDDAGQEVTNYLLHRVAGS